MSINEIIKKQIKDNAIIIYMKGTPEAPSCGFSARAANILKSYGLPFAAVNVLENPDIRQGIKSYSNWPTIPQVYIKQQLIGGSDILAEMHDSGELQKLLADI